MEKQYYLHRISHEYDISYRLIQNGYLSIGWSKFTDISNKLLGSSDDEFDLLMKEVNQKGGSKSSLKRFKNFNIGDIILVPFLDKELGIYEVESTPMPISSLKNIIDEKILDENIIFENEKLYNTQTAKYIDLGFVVKVKKICRKRRNLIDGKLSKFMTIPSTNINITQVNESINNLINDKNIVSLKNSITEKISADVKDTILKNIHSSDEFERLVARYLSKKGASYVYILDKESCTQGDDADIIATFEDLKVVFYVQVRYTKSQTNDFVINQIMKYKEQKEAINDEYTYIPWIISSGTYSQKAKTAAQDNDIRLIDMDEFAGMFIDCGFDEINNI
ncbi:MAG: restriction endonuclease [Peptoanaerobacter stomatis]|uniref:restriction endonuclease n=1 Tax=Peptoanaerobacter stomatis TaxID=796937 RepID=UPI003FA18573